LTTGTVIVLAMHGVPPNDFPRAEIMEFFGLDARFQHGPKMGPGFGEHDPDGVGRRRAELDAKIRAWPRTAENDPFYAASCALAAELRGVSGCEVVLGFNEFCAPTLDEALDGAAALRPRQVVVVTAMVTPGGEHSEVDIPRAISRARERHPRTKFTYAWPVEIAHTARFLADQVARFL